MENVYQGMLKNSTVCAHVFRLVSDPRRVTSWWLLLAVARYVWDMYAWALLRYSVFKTPVFGAALGAPSYECSPVERPLAIGRG